MQLAKVHVVDHQLLLAQDLLLAIVHHIDPWLLRELLEHGVRHGERPVDTDLLVAHLFGKSILLLTVCHDV